MQQRIDQVGRAVPGEFSGTPQPRFNQPCADLRVANHRPYRVGDSVVVFHIDQ
jgi:hypothetical protein